MKLAILTFAVVASLQQCVSAAEASPQASSVLADAAAKKAVEELVAVPIGEAWKDVYDAVVRKRGSSALRKLRYRLASLFGKSDPRALAGVLMAKLKEEVFDGKVNEEMWDALTMELYYALKEWWGSTPENPREAADLGSWQALVHLYKNLLGPALRGSSRVGSVNEILLDPDLLTIRRWVDEWKGVQPAKARSSDSGSTATGD